MISGLQYFDRDLSWLSFNERVLMEASQASVPLLERFRFLSIFSSNLDEFYRVRMPAIIAIQRINKEKNEENIYVKVVETINRQQQLFGSILNNQLIPELKKSGYLFLNNEEIPAFLEQELTGYFFTHIAGLLHPVLLTPESTFFPENNQLYLAVAVKTGDMQEQMYLVNIPCDFLSRFFAIEYNHVRYILFLEDIIRKNLHHIFKHAEIEAYNIKITRDAELGLDDAYDEDLADKIEKQLRKREMGMATRFLYQPEVPLQHLQLIIRQFNLYKAAVVEGGKHHNLKDLATLPIQNENLKYAALKPGVPFSFEDNAVTLFRKIAEKDRLIHTPYHSYDAVIRFFNEAAIDTEVEEIFTTLYRVAGNSRIAQALISAAKVGKKVTVLVELKARFDEANNIRWAKKMKPAGVKIIYTDNRLKVHAKVALVKRKNKKFPYLGLLATGNFNETTAQFYTDHILLTAHQEMLAELNELFFFLSKRKKPAREDMIDFRHLLVSQFNLQSGFIKLITREIKNAQQGLSSGIIIKMNNLEEEVLISKLYEASNAGVPISLIIRGICRLVPGVKGQSENISVIRIVDRYLEHGRVFIFHNNEKVSMYMGSADWMNRNIYRRIEVCFPLYNEKVKMEMQDIISLQLRDNVKAVKINSSLEQIPVTPSDKIIRSQEEIFRLLAT